MPVSEMWRFSNVEIQYFNLSSITRFPKQLGADPQTIETFGEQALGQCKQLFRASGRWYVGLGSKRVAVVVVAMLLKPGRA